MIVVDCVFQSTHPRRVWRLHMIMSIFHWCFNPHTHAGCDIRATEYLQRWKVSIHTPTQGVTPVNTAAYTRIKVSIHTPTQGVTFASVLVDTDIEVSIHTPTQGVTNKARIRVARLHVSIHTPTQGVTVSFSKLIPSLKFQSTHPRRVWLRCLNTNAVGMACFNPHTHAGCDLNCTGVLLYHYCFNPHTHAGCDVKQLKWVIYGKVSIHTPTQGVTKASPVKVKINMFQSTHPRRVWLKKRVILVSAYVSIHTPTQGVTSSDILLPFKPQVSIHTPTQGVTMTIWKRRSMKTFQSTHPRRVWLFMEL